MSRKRKAKKSKAQPAKPEGFIDRRGFVTTVAGTVVGGVILDGLHALHEPQLANITPPAERAVSLRATFGTPYPTPVHITVQVADAIALADAPTVTVTEA